MNWRRLALLDLALLALMVLASRAALLLHEAVGHGLTAIALGAQAVTFRFSLFGGGYLAPAGLKTGAAGYAIFSLGGIAVNLLTGAAAWIAARRMKRRGLLHAFLLLFGAGSLAQALFYLANGFYYGEGDPQGFVGPRGDLSRLQWMWVLFVLPFGAVAGFAARGYLDFLSGHAPVDSPRRRLGWTAATVGVVTAAYFGLWAATWDSRVDVTLRQKRVEAEIAREQARRPLPPPPPPASPAPPAPVLRPTVTEAEVAHRVPRPVSSIVMFAAALLAGLVVLWRAQPPPAEPAQLSTLRASVPMALAVAAIGAITLMGK